MKKSLQVILVILTSVGLITGLTACVQKGAETESTSVLDPDNLQEYYGCPNSKRICKLNLKKKRVS